MTNKQAISQYNLEIVMYIHELGLQELKKTMHKTKLVKQDGTCFAFNELVQISNKTMSKLLQNVDIKN